MSFGTPSYATTTPTGALGMNEAVGMLKEYYGGQKVKIMAYKKSPFLAMVRKDTNFVGKLYPQPVVTETSTGGSASFSTSQTNANPASIQEFIVTRTKAYEVAYLDRETMLAAKNDAGAFMKTATLLVDGAISTISQKISGAVFRDGTGNIGAFTVTDISTGVITLDDPNSIVNFQKNMVLECRTAAGGSTVSNALGYVIAINRAKGTLTVSATAGGSAGTPGSSTNAWGAANSLQYLNVQGNNNAVATGLQGWLPTTAPASNDSFFSVNRSSDSRLYGTNYDGSNQSIEEAIIDAAAILDQEGGSPDVCILSTRGYAALDKALMGKATYEVWEDETAQVSFKGIVLNTPTGVVRVFSDRFCPGKCGFLLQMDTWVLASLLEVPHIVDFDSEQEMLRVYNADAYELRVSALYNLACNAPGWNAQLKLVA